MTSRLSNTSGLSAHPTPPATDVPVLVPRRADGGERDRIWKRLYEDHWRGWPVYEGHHDGPGLFNRSAALNTAATLAGDWAEAVVADADTAIAPAQLIDAIDLARETQRLVIAHSEWVNVENDEVDRFLATGALRWRDGRLVCHLTVSSMLVVPRTVWDAVGGFDEGFVGYGYEDNAFAYACRLAAGKPERMVGPVWHLSHEQDRPHLRTQLRHPSTQANRQRWRRYQTAKTPEQIRAIRSESV